MLDRAEPVVQARSPPPSHHRISTGGAFRLRLDGLGILVEAGIPCVVYGPVGAGLHTADEWVDLASVDTCVTAFERLARSFCG